MLSGARALSILALLGSCLGDRARLCGDRDDDGCVLKSSSGQGTRVMAC